jgi:hypothetical protein
MVVANTPAYLDIATIMAVERLKVQAPDNPLIKHIFFSSNTNFVFTKIVNL